jgi:hypothetical protein
MVGLRHIRAVEKRRAALGDRRLSQKFALTERAESGTMDLPEPPRPDRRPPPPPTPQRPAPKPVWMRWWFWVGVVIVLAAIGNAVGDDDGTTSDVEAADGSSECLEPATAWLDTLQSAFYPEHRDAAITSSAYVETETSEGTAYYVAVTVDGVSGVAVFGTSDPPLQSNPGLMAGANAAAVELSDLRIDFSEDSSAGALLLDDGGTAAAESCL